MTTSGFAKIPDYLFENYIIPYLDSNDLFYNVRGTCTKMFKNVQNTLQINFPEEMLTKLKEICKLNQNEDLTRQFEQRANKLLNDRNLLFLYSFQLNFASAITQALNEDNNEKVIQLIKLFFTVTKNQPKSDLLTSDFELFKATMLSEEAAQEMRQKIEDVLNIDFIDVETQNYIDAFYTLDEEYLRNAHESISCIFVYLGKLIEFQSQKIAHRQLRQRLDEFFQKITQTSDLWPSRKIFFEKVVQFVEKSESSTTRIRKLIKLFERFEIESPINDFYCEKIFVNDVKKEEMYASIIKNRNNLTEKILRLDKMVKFYKQHLITDEDETKVDDLIFKVEGKEYNLPNFLMVLSMIKPSLEISPLTFKTTDELIRSYQKCIS